MTQKEVFIPIQGYEDFYKISNFGNVKSVRNNLLLKQHKTEKGYLKVQLKVKGVKKCMRVHRLVALHFLENKLNKKEVNHIDFNKLNNHVSNLEWLTGRENLKHFNKKILDKESILTIKNSLLTNSKLCLLFNVSYKTVWRIKNNISHKNV